MHSPLAKPSATREVLERHGFSLKRSLGQNFLVDDAVVGKILGLAGVRPQDVVLEVGPGIGTLTCALLEHCAAVISVERDPALPEVLADTLSEYTGRFVLVEKDALDVDAGDIERAVRMIGSGRGRGLRPAARPTDACSLRLPDKLVANLPYAVAATVVLGYMQRFESLQSATVMVQREVAQRMAAKPGTKSYGAYTVKLSMYAAPAGSFDVAPSCFMPPPHVESTVLRLDRRDVGGLAAQAGIEAGGMSERRLVEAACTMADAAFFARRKTVANSCRQYFSSHDPAVVPEIPDILAKAGIDGGIRGERLDTLAFLRLGSALTEVL